MSGGGPKWGEMWALAMNLSSREGGAPATDKCKRNILHEKR